MGERHAAALILPTTIQYRWITTVKILLAIILLNPVASLAYDSKVTPGYADPPPSAVTVTDISYTPGVYFPGFQQPIGSCSIMINTGQYPIPGGAWYLHTDTWIPDPPPATTDKGTCRGVHFDGIDYKGFLVALAASYKGQRVPLLFPSNQPHYCGITISVTPPHGRTFGTGTFSCDTVQSPVMCDLRVTEDIRHQPRTAGPVRSLSNGSAVINCTGTTSVSLQPNNSTVQLLSGQQILPSKLYVGAEGNMRWQGTVVSAVTISLISVIEGYSESPGLYSGSTVLTASWD